MGFEFTFLLTGSIRIRLYYNTTSPNMEIVIGLLPKKLHLVKESLFKHGMIKNGFE